MANRRMFSLDVIDTDAFLDMPCSARLLYFDLGMRADDEGFLRDAQKIQRFTGATKDDMNVLVARGFVIPFESGVVVIRHWKQHNYIPKDRFRPTQCLHEKASLSQDELKNYVLLPEPVYKPDTGCIQTADNAYTQVRLGKDIDNIMVADAPSSKKKRFTPPTVDEVAAYCKERQNGIDPQAFIDHYTASGWMRGKTPIKDWKACVRTWEKNRANEAPSAQKGANSFADFGFEQF